ncbi:Hsp70 family protein [Nocardia sp. NPDC059246]|uniref:Hsp70 family protein n=1 Tax=unclassified Nocardia TaxID=2637762 RepID=UPI003698049C
MAEALGIVIGSDAFVRASNSNRRSARIPGVIRFESADRPVLGTLAGTYAHSDSNCEFRDFTTRVGDPIPVVAGDGTARTGAQLVATAIALLLEPGCTAVVAHPVTWTEQAVRELRESLAQKPTHATLANEAEAAVAALRASGEVDPEATLLLCNVGKSGMDVAVVTAIGDSVRVDQAVHCHEFGGDLVDSLFVAHVLDQVAAAHPGFDPADRRNWPALRELRTGVTRAKHQLSSNVSATIEVNLPGIRDNLRIVRSELESVIADPVWQAVQRITQSLDSALRTGHAVDCIVLTGGSSAIPLLTENLSAATEVPIITTTDPAHTVIRGATLLAARTLRTRPRLDSAARVLPPGISAAAAAPAPERAPVPQPRSAAPQPKPMVAKRLPTSPPPRPGDVGDDRSQSGRRTSRPALWAAAVAAAVLAVLGGVVVAFDHTPATGPHTSATSQAPGHPTSAGGHH